jgi:hypothetical protein
MPVGYGSSEPLGGDEARVREATCQQSGHVPKPQVQAAPAITRSELMAVNASCRVDVVTAPVQRRVRVGRLPSASGVFMGRRRWAVRAWVHTGVGRRAGVVGTRQSQGYQRDPYQDTDRPADSVFDARDRT